MGRAEESFRAGKAKVSKPADWKEPLDLLGRLKTMQLTDPYILQQLALATYKHEQPDKTESLIQAKMILRDLAPESSSDAETVALWGAIHKRLWEELRRQADLDGAARGQAAATHRTGMLAAAGKRTVGAHHATEHLNLSAGAPDCTTRAVAAHGLREDPHSTSPA